jgi:hypothetical protein
MIVINVTDLLITLLGGGSVGAFQRARHATIRWKCFVSAHGPLLCNAHAACTRSDVTQECVAITWHVFSLMDVRAAYI